MKETTLLMAAVLAAATATVLVAGIAVVPTTFQNAQALIPHTRGISITSTAQEQAQEDGPGDTDQDIDQDSSVKCKFFDDVEVNETP
jgi:hypothetical protein